MPSHFSSVGFQVETEEEFAALAMQAAEEGVETLTARGYYLRWSPGAGAQLWTQASLARAVTGCNPHFEGTGRVHVAVTAALRDDQHPLDGGFHAWANPGEGEHRGDYPFFFDAPDFEIAAQNENYPRRAVAQVAAFAEELACWPDEETYTQAQKGKKPSLAAESFIPTGLFTKDGGRPRATALFTGRILQAELRINPASGADFYWLNVQTLGGVYDVVADPVLVSEPPVVGGIAQGSFWLSGRLLPEAGA